MMVCKYCGVALPLRFLGVSAHYEHDCSCGAVYVQEALGWTGHRFVLKSPPPDKINPSPKDISGSL
jgi:hypothetical protein